MNLPFKAASMSRTLTFDKEYGNVKAIKFVGGSKDMTQNLDFPLKGDVTYEDIKRERGLLTQEKYEMRMGEVERVVDRVDEVCGQMRDKC